MRDKTGKIIYIGKAKNLRNRVSGYFRENPNHTPKVSAMVENVFDYDFIVTDSEYEALVLECSLIKQHMPKYNILLKDDKGYHYICVSAERFPRIYAANSYDGSAVHLGPYMSSTVARETAEEVNKVFMLPTCHKNFPRDFGKERPCLNFHIKTCMGVCRGKISEENYREIVDKAVEYIKNGSTDSVERMEREMNEAAENLDFEKAAVLRDRIAAVKRAAEKQKIIIDYGVRCADFIGMAEYGGYVYVSVLVYRENRLYDKIVIELEKNEDDVLGSFISEFYHGRDDIPKVVITDHLPEENTLLEEFLSRQSGRKVRIAAPVRGRLRELLRLAVNNSVEYAAIKNQRTGIEVTALEELGRVLALDKPPEYIEAYDISNLSSESIVGGMVVFQNGRPLKKAYKRFIIKEQNQQNDYGSMQETLRRRLMHIGNSDDEYFRHIPDLILIDGGKGHVNAVKEVMNEMGYNIPVFGMVKDNRHRTRAIADGGEEIQINNLKPVFMLITRIQDEVHRYSVSFMHSRHNRKMYETELTAVKGIGQKKAEKLMMKYRTKENLKNASPEELARTIRVNEKIARELWELIQTMK
jgi:excinuclease ABC subunit C